MSVEHVEQILADIMNRKEKEQPEMEKENNVPMQTDKKTNQRQKGPRFLPKPAPPPLYQKPSPPTGDEDEDEDIRA